ncbi:hypothetical protein LWI29_028787 [Acer saccharum]|uniref:RNase H type-1 domain-containing protein n=1 Tax=Acer saccharum TaxID=4024 RepID=A0AA39RU50_ACESA|nr:hypothetical protein LWI29_028787 [Acer saccharum]
MQPALDGDKGRYGAGLVERNDKGEVVLVAALSFKRKASVDIAEAKTVLEGILLAEEFGLFPLALAWSPFQANLLAIGGESVDGCIKFWNTHTDAYLNSTDTGSLVSTLLWNKNEMELLSSHGFPHNQLTF